MDGALNGNYSPTINIEMYGQLSNAEQQAQLYEAIIDTGFTGAVSIPLVKALPMGLTLFSTASYTLADGSQASVFLCFGIVRLNGAERTLVFSLSQGNDILLGTEFLAAFNAKLELNYRTEKFTLTTQ